MRQATHKEDHTVKMTYKVTTVSQIITIRNVTYVRLLELLKDNGINDDSIVTYTHQVA